ncbi:MAG TPA: ethylbenzene dehydrogenase-related protein [Candidatus Angelobacter sp.]|nr:ethylbenzene dehydrogenase-related protein [Candidatus Angelobacter sp.]
MRKMKITIPALLVLLLLAGCKKTPAPATEVIALTVTQLPSGPANAAWDAAPEYVAKLIPQDLVEPRLGQASTPEVRVQALTNGTEMAFRLRWADPVKSDAEVPGQFVDACAVQVPAKLMPNPPAPQMGEAGNSVQIAYWRADWQAWVNGREDNIKSIYPNAEITHYPFQASSLPAGSPEQKEMAKRYAPADAVGNRRQGPRESAVESLLAEGPGTLSPNPAMAVSGNGIRTRDGWAVMIVRPVPEGLAPGSKNRTSIAFAVWQGANKEAGARKMRSGWAPLAIREKKS